LTIELVLSAFRDAVPHWDVANQLRMQFQNAALPPPDLFSEVPVGGGEDSPFYAWAVESLRSMQPQLVKIGIISDHVLSIETLEERLRMAVVEARSQIEAPAQICAWTRLAS
jgi:DNA-binding protein YbaB